jgi:ATP-dependent helicase/nuclease subunit B
MSPHMVQPLLNAMQQGALIITPTKHLAHTLTDLFFKTFPKAIQPKPQCFPYQTFLNICYDSLIQQMASFQHPKLLTPVQAQFLWESIGKTLDVEFAMQEGNNKAIFSAWKLSKTWHLPLEHALFSQSAQTQVFQVWAQCFDNQLAERDAITEQTLIPYLADFSLKFPYQQIIFSCFDDFNPQQLAFQNYLSQQGIDVELYDLPQTKQSTLQYAALDEKSERRALFDWLNEKKQSDAPIAVLVPHLDQQGAQLKRWFQFYFPDTAVHFSLGQPLSNYPLVSQALSFLTLFTNEFTIEQAKLLLHASFMTNSDTEKLARSHFSIQDPALQSRFLTPAGFIKALSQTCPALSQLLTQLSAYPAEASPAQWAALFTQRLTEFGFPGPVALNSENYQAYQRLLDLLHTFKTLTCIQPTLSKQAALLYFKQLVQQTLFQPQQTNHASIHVLGLLEAAGSPYSAIWIMGLSEQHFPNIISPTPFIPLKLQQAHQMPHTDLNHEMHLATLRLRRFQHASESLVLSYPQASHDVQNRPSTLIQHFPPHVHAPLEKNVSNTLERYQDALYFPVTPSEQLPKGTQVLSEQAKCGFRAFASIRLFGKTTEPLNSGLTPKTRGILLHKSLEAFWQQVKSQQNLMQLTEDELHQLIKQAIHFSFHQLRENEFLADPLRNLEMERLQRLIFTSLTWEKNRPAYEIETLEKNYHIELGPLSFQVRLDRLDKLSEHEKWVIDYKTSLPSPLPWYEEETLEPQLLLYALLDPAIQVILFHELKKGQSMVKGLSAKPYASLSLTALKENETWDDHRARWKAYLTQLAQAFFDGHWMAQPKAEMLCKSCSYQSLCRLPLT